MTVGRHTYGAEHITVLWPQAEIEIGSFCSIAPGVTIFAGGGHALDRGTTYPFGHVLTSTFPAPPLDGHPVTRGPVRIGHDVWIGANASIMSGVRIGNGAVIGAHSHVVTSVKPYAVVGGNPAQVYCFRHPPDVVHQLLAMRWWDLPDEQIREIVPLLTQRDLVPLFAWWKDRVSSKE